jgi:hypothetical protein
LSDKQVRKRIKQGKIPPPRPSVPPQAEAERARTDEGLLELARLVGRLQEENRTLAGQLGFLQAQLLQAQDALGAARETILALEAPAAAAPVAEAPPATATAPPDAAASESAPDRRGGGWRFWRRPPR